jgi:hypothetical protein
MRKIETKEDIDAKKKRNNKIFTLFMLFILVGGTVGYAFSLFMGTDEFSQTDSEGAGRVQNYGNQWVITWAGNQHVFSNSPESSFNVTEMNFIPDISKYYNKPLYIDSESDIISNEIGLNLGVYSERVNRACYEDCEESNYVEKNCSDNLIIYRKADENTINQEDNCIFIDGDMRAVDAFLYREIGIA